MTQINNHPNISHYLRENSKENSLILEVTTEHFKKYNTIQITRKINPAFNIVNQTLDQNSLQQETKNKQSNKKKSKQQTNQQLAKQDFNNQKTHYNKYLPKHSFNFRNQSLNHALHTSKFIMSNQINNVITIDNQNDHQIGLIGQNLQLHHQLSHKKQRKEINLPKLQKTATIIEIIQKQFNQAKQNKIKRRHWSNNLKPITINSNIQNYSLKDQQSHLHQNHLAKIPSNQSFTKQGSSKQLLNPLMDHDLSQINKNKQKIQLMGMKLKPIHRQEPKISQFTENRTERVGSLNLLPSELIYKNPKKSIQKSVYEQLIKRVFSSN